MNYKSFRTLSVLAGCSLIGVLTAQAQDQATLDLLVKKGLITQSEADTVAKAAATPVITSRGVGVQKIKLEGLVQGQYDWLSAQDRAKGAADPVATNQMYFRRVMLGMQADVGNGWGGEIMMDFAATQIADQPKSGLSPQATPTTLGTTGGQQGIQYISQNMFDKIAITKQLPDFNGVAEMGYDKTNFIQEELTSTASLPAIERSIATRYFDEYYGSPTAYRLGFAQRRTGLFWKGTVPGVDGLYYSAAFTNGIQSDINYVNVGGLNKFGGWFGAGYKNKADVLGGISYDFGVNGGYSGDGNSENSNIGHGQHNQSNDTMGWNPYLNVTMGKFSLLSEFFQARFQNGRSTVPFTSTNLVTSGTTSAASPYGVNITGVYNITPEWQAVARFTYLSTNGRGTDQNGVLWNAPNDIASSVSAAGVTHTGGLGPLFDNSYAFYLGANWNISPGVRFSFGYELAQFVDRQVYTAADNGTSTFNGPRTDMGLIRARLQVLF